MLVSRNSRGAAGRTGTKEEELSAGLWMVDVRAFPARCICLFLKAGKRVLSCRSGFISLITILLFHVGLGRSFDHLPNKVRFVFTRHLAEIGFATIDLDDPVFRLVIPRNIIEVENIKLDTTNVAACSLKN